MNEQELKWQIFRKCMQDLRDVERRLRLIGEIMLVDVWWIPSDYNAVQFSCSTGTDLRKRTIYNRKKCGRVSVMELFKE